MSPFFILFILAAVAMLFILWPLLRQMVRIGSVYRHVQKESQRRRDEAEEQATREERSRKSSADILREAQHDLDGGSYVEYEEVDEVDREER